MDVTHASQSPPSPTPELPGGQPGAGPATATGGAAMGPPEPDSLMHNVQQLLRDIPGLISDRVHLLALELKRSGLALAQMVGLVVAAGVLLCTAWLALWVGIGVALVQAGLGWGWTLVLILLLNLGAAWLAIKRVMSLARFLSLPATVRRLTLSTPPAPPRTDVPVPSATTSSIHKGSPTDERATAAAGTS